MRKLSQAVEQSPASVMITDTRGNIEYVNRAFTLYTGYEADEVMGRNPRFLQSGHTQSSQYQHLWKQLASGKEWRGEFHNRKKDGELYWTYSTLNPITDAEGKITHYLESNENITQRKEYEERLLQQVNFDTLTALPNCFSGLRNHAGILFQPSACGERLRPLFGSTLYPLFAMKLRLGGYGLHPDLLGNRCCIALPPHPC